MLLISRWQFGMAEIVYIKGNENLVILFFAYIFGYVIYSLDFVEALTKFAFRAKTTGQILDDIKSSDEYIASMSVLKELWIDNQKKPIIDLSKLHVLSLRSIVMSYSPESDTKIYTFMFRSELCRTVGTFSVFCGSAGLLSAVVNLFFKDWTLFKINAQYLFTYGILILVGLLLIKTRSRFLGIAYKIPFSIFLAKYYKIPKS